MSIIESPKSLKEFAEERGVDPLKAMYAYSVELDEYRNRFAEFLGVSLDALHDNFCQQEIDARVAKSPNAEGL